MSPSRREALAAGEKRYFTGSPCVHGHMAPRRASDGHCVECSRLRQKARMQDATYRAKWRIRNKKCLRVWEKQNTTQANNHRAARALRTRLSRVIRGGLRPGSAISDLGCSVDEFRSWITGQFLPDMSWGNYGKWHIDHIKPLSSFDLSIRSQFVEAVHFTNLQPLWARANLAKGAKCPASGESDYGRKES